MKREGRRERETGGVGGKTDQNLSGAAIRRLGSLYRLSWTCPKVGRSGYDAETRHMA